MYLKKFFRKQKPGRLIAFGFFFLILIGSVLLMLPVSVKDGVHLKYIDALYTSVSSVCVTGLITVDPGDTFTVFGHAVMAVLIQLGGLGVSSVGAGLILLVRKKIDLSGRNLIKEGSNLDSENGITGFLKDVFAITAIIETAGALVSYIVFSKDYPPLKAFGISVFHSIASFNNSGFDILGNFQSLTNYKDNVLLNITTSVLIILGGIGFLVIKECLSVKFNFKKLSMHTKGVLSVSLVLTVGGMFIFKLSERGEMTWLEAFFQSVSARTAGFSTFPMSKFTPAATACMLVLMFIGASPGSTGGGVKTTTVFVLFEAIKAAAANKSPKAFHYSIPSEKIKKAGVIVLLGLAIVCVGAWALLFMDPEVTLSQALVETVSAFGTVGLSTGITPKLSMGSKIISMIIMYIGRLGPLTVASIWSLSKAERVEFPEGNLAIG